MGCLVSKLNICGWQTDSLCYCIHADFPAFVLESIEETSYESGVRSV